MELDLNSLYNAFAQVGKSREEAVFYIVGMMSAKMSQKDFSDLMETIRVCY